MTFHEQVERAVVALERIAAALEGVSDLADQSPTVCTHPEDDRIDFGVTRGQADWQCRRCGFRSITER